MTGIEVFGYISMIIALVSMMMKDIKTLRIVNSIECAMFVVYGFILGAYPIVIMNILVIIINVHQILKKQ